jgi:predicted O-linked N-acetylglucosamine transferase (SPINDLY family)
VDAVSALNDEAVLLLSDHQSDAAITVLRRALELQPFNSNAMQLMGVAYYGKDDPVSAIDWIGRALDIEGWTSPDVVGNYILVLKDAGKFNEGVTAANRALELFPTTPIIIHHAALLHLRIGNVVYAISLLERYLDLLPRSFDKYELVAEVGINYRVFDPVFRLLHQGLTQFPGNGRLEFLLAVTHQASGDILKAIELLHNIIQKNPNFNDAIGSLASCYQTLGDLELAIKYYEMILSDSLEDTVFLNNYGAVLTNFKREIEGERWLRKSIEIAPNNVNALVNLGTHYQDNDDIEEAKQLFLRAASFSSSNGIGSIFNGGHSVLELRANTMLTAVAESWTDMIHQRRALMDGISSYIATSGDHPTEDSQGLDRTMFYLVYSGYNDRPILELLTDAYYRNLLNFGLTRTGVDPNIDATGNTKRKIRVGFASKFFGVYEPHALLLDGVMRYLPRDIYEVIAFPVLRTDGKPLAVSIEKFVDKVVEVPLFNRGAFEVIAKEELDVLVFADTQSEPINHFLCHNRMAAIQIAFWGNPITSGSRNIDFFVSGDYMEHPFRSRIIEGEEPYSEQVVLLEGQGIWYYPPDSEYLKIPEGNMYSELKSVPISRKDIDIPDDWFIFFCPQSVFKVHPLYDFVFSDILKAIPHAHVIVTDGRREAWTERYSNRLQRSIDPDVMDRFHMMRRISSEKFINLLKNVDVLLHPFPFDGSRTSADGLAVGVPVLTLPSEYLRGRMGAAFYRTMNIPEMVAKDRSHYIRIASRLANNRTFYSEISSQIRERVHLIWEDMDVPFRWVQMLHRLSHVPVPSWEQFISHTDRDVALETARRNARIANQNEFRRVFGAETWLIASDGAVHLPSMPRDDDEIPPIFSDWNKGREGASTRRKSVTEFAVHAADSHKDPCMEEANRLTALYSSADTLVSLIELLPRCDQNPKFQSRIALLELRASLTSDARRRCLSLENYGKSTVECLFVLGISSYLISDYETSLHYFVKAREESLISESGTLGITRKAVEASILKVLGSLNRTNDCLDVSELFLGIPQFDESGAAVLAASFVNWNSARMPVPILEDRLKMNSEIFDESSLIRQAVEIQKESGELLAPIFACVSSAELASDRMSWSNALRGLWKTLREIPPPEKHSSPKRGVQLIIPLLRPQTDQSDDLISSLLQASMTPQISSVTILANRSFSLHNSVLEMFTDRLLFGVELPHDLEGYESWLHWLWSSDIIRQGAPDDVIILGKCFRSCFVL